MINLIVATTISEQQNIMEYLAEELKSTYHNDMSVTVVQSGMSKIDVFHSVTKDLNMETLNLAVTYRVILVPISMSLDPLLGYSPTANININRLITRLDKMKSEAISFVNSHKTPSPLIRKQKEALANAAKHLFD